MNSPQQPNEEARSVHTERHYEKSGKSNKSKEKAETSSNASGNQYIRASSNVSNPDNLVCDNCVNTGMLDRKRKILEDQKAKDMEHAQRVHDNIKKQLEDEKLSHMEKMKVYQESIQNQKADLERRRAMEREFEMKEKEKLKGAMANRDDEIAREKRAMEIKE